MRFIWEEYGKVHDVDVFDLVENYIEVDLELEYSKSNSSLKSGLSHPIKFNIKTIILLYNKNLISNDEVIELFSDYLNIKKSTKITIIK